MEERETPYPIEQARALIQTAESLLLTAGVAAGVKRAPEVRRSLQDTSSALLKAAILLSSGSDQSDDANIWTQLGIQSGWASIFSALTQLRAALEILSEDELLTKDISQQLCDYAARILGLVRGQAAPR